MTDEHHDVMVVRLDAQSLDDLAQRVAALVRPATPAPSSPSAGSGGESRGRRPGQLLSAAQVAERWQVDRDWVYAHADQLGALRLGTGVRPRLRFDPGRVAAYLDPTGQTVGAPADGLTGGDVRR